MKNILLCIDGEQWTEKAINYAIDIAEAFQGNITALHVINPYLMKFADEIYAVGRNEYRNHIERELGKESDDIIAGFKSRADSRGVLYDVIVRCGSPEEEIIKETFEHSYDLLILGARPLTAFTERVRSCNLPMKIFKRIRIPAIFVR